MGNELRNALQSALSVMEQFSGADMTGEFYDHLLWDEIDKIRTALANARIADAAPDLYRELAHLVKLLEPCEDQLAVPGLATLNGARAALAKANGK